MEKHRYALAVGLMVVATALLIAALGDWQRAATFMGGVSFAIAADLGKDRFVRGDDL